MTNASMRNRLISHFGYSSVNGALTLQVSVRFFTNLREIVGKKEETLKFPEDKKVLIIGAGALGNFVGLALGYLRVKNITIIDPDEIEDTNLNRQILFYDRVGRSKSKVLAERLNKLFRIEAKAIKDYFTSKTSLNSYDILFDCVDNFKTRVNISKACKEKKILISGGTSYEAGQALSYNPSNNGEKTPAEILDLEKIVEERKIEDTRIRTSCVYQPDPSVIMSNQIIGGIMVDLAREISAKDGRKNTYYNENDAEKLRELGYSSN